MQSDDSASDKANVKLDPVAVGPPAPRAGELSVIGTLWLTYGAFYFCRVNISATVPGLQAPLEEGGLGIGGATIGWILGSLKITYALGQLINGQLSEQLPARKMLAIGMLGSAALCVCFGAGTAAYFLLFVWAMNGYCQSLGWTPCVRVMANWIPDCSTWQGDWHRRDWLSSDRGAVRYTRCAIPLELLGWRGAMFVPARVRWPRARS